MNVYPENKCPNKALYDQKPARPSLDQSVLFLVPEWHPQHRSTPVSADVSHLLTSHG